MCSFRMVIATDLLRGTMVGTFYKQGAEPTVDALERDWPKVPGIKAARAELN